LQSRYCTASDRTTPFSRVLAKSIAGPTGILVDSRLYSFASLGKRQQFDFFNGRFHGPFCTAIGTSLMELVGPFF